MVRSAVSWTSSFTMLAIAALVLGLCHTARALDSESPDQSQQSANYEFFKHHNNPPPNQNPNPSQPNYPSQPSENVPDGQRDIIAAQESGHGVDYVEVSEVTVTQILPDDTQGSKHQKWVVQLANGRSLLSVYNMSICERVPVKVGDVISMGGQYIWDKGGGLIHWIHEDPRGHRKNGFVEINGQRYGHVINPNGF
jgi:hypothetical protein